MELPWVHKKSITVVYKVFGRERIDDCYGVMMSQLTMKEHTRNRR